VYFIENTHLLHENDIKYFIRSIAHRQLYIFSTCLTICGCHAKKIVALLSQTSHLTIFVHLRKKWSAAEQVRVPSMQISGNRTEPSLVNKPHAKVFPNQMPQSFLWSVLLCVWWCFIMKQNHFVLPFLIFRSFFTQSLIQIDHLLSVVFSINSFARF